MIYLDTSVLGSIFFRETGAEDLLRRLEALSKSGLRISAWSLTELPSVGAIKQRVGLIDTVTRQNAMATFQRFASGNLQLSEVDPADFRAAAALIDGSINLRAGDALHLAIARRLGAAFMTLDKRQAGAARALGLKIA